MRFFVLPLRFVRLASPLSACGKARSAQRIEDAARMNLRSLAALRSDGPAFCQVVGFGAETNVPFRIRADLLR